MAIEPVPPLTDIPEFPALADRVNYNAKAYAFGSHMANTFNAEIEALADNVKNNADEALANAVLAQTSGDLVVMAQAAANFKGNYSALSGALNMPASVAHANDFWALNVNTANVASDVPGVSSKWTRLRTGTGGAIETTTAGSVVLTPSSARVQSIAMTATDQSVTMPNATLISTGGEIVIVKNSGEISYPVRNAANGHLVMLDPGQIAVFYLVNNSTSAGVWSVGMIEGVLAQTIFQATGLNLNADASTGLSVTTLTPSLVIAAYRAGSNCYAVTLGINGNVISPGTILDLGTAADAQSVSVTAMSATTAVVVYTAITTGYLVARHLTVIGGNTLSPGTQLTVNAVASFVPTVVSVSATQAVVAYKGTTSFLQACTLNVTGTTLSPGTIVSVRSAAIDFCDLTVMWGSQVLVVSSATTVQACALGISGTNLTPGTPLTLNADAARVAVVSLSSTQAVVMYDGVAPMYKVLSRVLTLAGSTITAGSVAVQSMHITGVPAVTPSLARLTPTRVMAFTGVNEIGGTGNLPIGRVQLLGVVDGATKVGLSSPMKSAVGSRVSITALSSTRALALYTQASGYVQARILEIGL